MNVNRDLKKTERIESVVLFDIDGTLLRGLPGRRSAGFTAMHRALAQTIGIDVGSTSVDFAGRTDRRIARMLLRTVGEDDPTEERIDSLLARYLENLAEMVPEAPYQVLGDPVSAVSELRLYGARIGLGTGNIRGGARIKLANADILHLFNLDFGGFGDDGEDRVQLIASAVRRCDPSGRLPVIVVGDTPYDIDAAHACGAYCVAVPFGQNSGETLRAAGADRVVPQVDGHLAEVVCDLLNEQRPY